MSALGDFLKKLIFPKHTPDDATVSYDVRLTMRYLALALSIGCILAFFHVHSAVPILWALACTFSGAAIGFLFGLPRVLQSDTLSASDIAGLSGYRQLVSTKIEEIADWLTKIIVGLGLVQLREIPRILGTASSFVARGIGMETDQQTFACALILYFSILGLFAGYILTRMFLAPAFGRADLEANAQRAQRAKVESLAADMSIVKQRLPQGSHPVDIKADGSEAHADLPRELAQLISDYNESVSINEWKIRVAKKREIADKMVASGANANRDILANGQTEGSLVALAALSRWSPERRDVELLLSAARRVHSTFARMQIVKAIAALQAAKMVEPKDEQSIEEVFQQFESVDHDRNLIRSIGDARALAKE